MALVLLLLLTAIGIGPVLLARKARLHDISSWLLAAPTGLAIIVLVCTVLVDLQLPILSWARIATFFLIVASFFLACYCQIRFSRDARHLPADASNARERHREIKYGLLAVIVGGLIAFLPVQLGGRWYCFNRGNAWDASTYVAGASALMHAPFSRLVNPDLAALAELNTVYPQAQPEFIHERWATLATLGWSASVLGQAPYSVAPQYSVLSLMMVIGTAFVLARRLRAGFRWAMIASILVAIGFWAQFAFDLQSLAQLDAMVMTFLLLAVWPAPSNVVSWNPFRDERLLVLLACCAWPLIYPQHVPWMFAGVGFGLALSFIRAKKRLLDHLPEAVPVIVGFSLAAILVPIFRILLRNTNIVTVEHGRDNWLGTQHMWLANNPLAGFWGLTHLDAGFSGPWSASLGLAVIILSCVLTTLLVYQLLAKCFDRQVSITDCMMVGMILLALAQAVLLLCLRQYWAAAKGAGYLAPLCLVGLISWWGAGASMISWPDPNLRRLFASAVLLFCLSQAWSGILRIVLVARQSDYVRYVNNIPWYRTVDFEIDPIRKALGRESRTQVALVMANPWLQNMARIELGFDSRIVEPLGVTSIVSGTSVAPSQSRGKVDFWLFDKQAMSPAAAQQEVVARTSDLTLVRDFPFLIQISSPNGMEPDASTGQTSFWIGDKPVTIQVNSPTAGTAVLTGQFFPGPSLRSTELRTVRLSGEALQNPIEHTISGETTDLRFPVQPGVNNLQITCISRPDSTVEGDPRTLLLRVVGPNVQFLK